jgi:DUF1680 family protein
VTPARCDQLLNPTGDGAILGGAWRNTTEIRVARAWDVRIPTPRSKGMALMTTSSGIIDNRNSPCAARRSVGVKSVRWIGDSFRARRFKQLKEVTLPWLWACMWDPDQGDMQSNIDIFAGRKDGEIRGTYWQDELIHKWIEAAVYVMDYDYDPDLDAKIDQCAEILADVQKEDGYLVLTQPLHGTRFMVPRFHELYNMGHLITAGVAHYRLTGKTNLFAVAKKAADCMRDEFVPNRHKYANFSITKSYIMAVVDLYRATGEKTYLELANVFVDLHGAKAARQPEEDKHAAGDALATAERNLAPGCEIDTRFVREAVAELQGTDMRQTRVPLRKETRVVGHAVNFEYLYASAADVYMETGDGALLDALRRLWDDLHGTKMAVHGGVSPFQRHLSIRRDKVGECVGDSHDIPNSGSYHETCSQIGDCMWAHRMLLIEGDARYADQMELEMFNATIASIGLDGTHWFYINPTKWLGDHEAKDGAKRLGRRYRPCEPPQYAHTCCPTNLARFEAQMRGYMYSRDEEGVFVDHYAAGALDCQAAGGRLRLEQATDYPWDGRATFRIQEAPAGELSLRFRVPGWCRGASATLNGENLDLDCAPSSYECVRRAWKPDDELVVELPMIVRQLRAHPKVESCKRQSAIMRGPIVYCLESVDLPDGVSVEQAVLPSAPEFHAARSEDLLGGVVALETELLVESIADWDGPLYGEFAPAEPKRIETRLIPYYAWGNRGECEMTVWLPRH